MKLFPLRGELEDAICASLADCSHSKVDSSSRQEYVVSTLFVLVNTSFLEEKLARSDDSANLITG